MSQHYLPSDKTDSIFGTMFTHAASLLSTNDFAILRASSFEPVVGKHNDGGHTPKKVITDSRESAPIPDSETVSMLVFLMDGECNY